MSEHLSPEDLGGLVMLEPTDPERERAEAHIRECAACRESWVDASRTLAMLDALDEPEPPSHAALARARAAVLRELEAESAGSQKPAEAQKATETQKPAASDEAARGSAGAALAIPLAAVVAFVVLLVIGAAGQVYWRLALLGLLVSGGRSAWALYRNTVREAWVSIGFTVALSALIASRFVRLDEALAIGPGCTLQELAASALPLGMAVYLAQSRRIQVTPWSLGAAAACGALAGQLALLSLCPHRDPGHLFLLHVGGVLLATVAAVGVGYRLKARDIV